MLKRALQVVEDGQQFLQQTLVRVFRVLFLVFLGAFLIILEFSGQPEVAALDVILRILFLLTVLVVFTLFRRPGDTDIVCIGSRVH